MKTKNLLLISGAGLLLIHFFSQKKQATITYTGPDQAAVPELPAQQGTFTPGTVVNNNFNFPTS